jgi:hypothetical protein
VTLRISGANDISLGFLSTLLCLWGSAGCNLPEVSSTSSESRYQLTKDRDGRVLRLDTVTGEVTVAAPTPVTVRPTPPARADSPPAETRGNVAEPADTRSLSGSIPASTSTAVTPEPRPTVEITAKPTGPALGTAGIDMCARQEIARQAVTLADAPVYVEPRVTQAPITTLASAVLVAVAERSGDWVLLRFNDARWGPRAGYVHCRQLRALDIQSVEPRAVERPQPEQPAARAPLKPVESAPIPTGVTPPAARDGRVETVQGYAEWIRDGHLIAGGQRIAWDGNTRLKAGNLRSPHDIPLGSEVVAKGVRTTNGALFAREIEVKPNGIALYENDVLQQSDAVETIWVREGVMFLGDGRTRRDFGRVLEAGEGVDRSRSIMARLVPPYVDARRIRVRVVDDSQWNARAMANGAIWVHRGLLEDTSDDELAVVLGHELAHYTHEHIRRSARNDMWRQLAALGAAAAVEAMDSPAGRQAVVAAARLSLLAWGNGYNRNLEDEADRVGLRYAYESGFDVTQGVALWTRKRSRSGEMDPVTNWIVGSHSRPTDRIKNIERELALNYRRPLLDRPMASYTIDRLER